MGVVGGTVVLVVVVDGGVVVVGGGVVVVVLRVGLGSGGALAGDVATGGPLSTSSSAPGGRVRNGVRDEVLGLDGAKAVMAAPLTPVVVLGLFALAVGTVVVPCTCWTASVGGGRVSVTAKAHTAPLTASTATTSVTPGYQIPSR